MLGRQLRMTAYWLEIDTRAVSTPLPLLAITGSSEPLVITSVLPSASDVPGKASECLVVARSGHSLVLGPRAFDFTLRWVKGSHSTRVREGGNSGDNKAATRLTYINDVPAYIQPR